jgi:hypothetical protein
LGERAVTKSENARQVILKYEQGLYYIGTISVRFHDGEPKHSATFHARRAENNQYCDLELEIPQTLYEILLEYTKMGNPDLILILSLENKEFKWSLISESWLKNYSNAKNAAHYVV